MRLTPVATLQTGVATLQTWPCFQGYDRHTHAFSLVYFTASLLQGLRGLYRGYMTTVFREVPFSFIQYPLWEYLKVSSGLCEILHVCDAQPTRDKASYPGLSRFLFVGLNCTP